MPAHVDDRLESLQFDTYRKLYLVVGFYVVLLLFGDTILLFVGYCLHVLFEFIASLFEHWLQTTFKPTERQAQIVFIYLFATIASLIGWRLSKMPLKQPSLLTKPHIPASKQGQQL